MKSKFQTGKALAIGAVLAGFLTVLCFASRPTRFPSLKLMYIGSETNQSTPCAVLRLTNVGPRSIYYAGYETNLPWTSYDFQTSGTTTNFCPFFCGTGVQEYTLRARQSVDFKVEVIDQSNYQICLQYCLHGTLDKLRRMAPNWVARRLPYPRLYKVTSAPLPNDRASTDRQQALSDVSP